MPFILYLFTWCSCQFINHVKKALPWPASLMYFYLPKVEFFFICCQMTARGKFFMVKHEVNWGRTSDNEESFRGCQLYENSEYWSKYLVWHFDFSTNTNRQFLGMLESAPKLKFGKRIKKNSLNPWNSLPLNLYPSHFENIESGEKQNLYSKINRSKSSIMNVDF